MSILLDRFIRELKLQNLSDNTIDNYGSIITKLSKLTGKPLLQLSRDDITTFFLRELTVEKLAPRTINLHIGCIKTFYKLMSGDSGVMKTISSMKGTLLEKLFSGDKTYENQHFYSKFTL